jgi:hypothetical protein
MDIVKNGFVSKQLFIKEINDVFENEEEFLTDFTSIKGERLVEYKDLLDCLENISKLKSKDPHDRGLITKAKGEALENIVNFIIKNTSILQVYENVPTSTNEIDQVITLNHKGKRVREISGISYDTLGLEGECFLGECKNYNKSVGTTWVGKFFSLLKICGACKLGIIFSFFGLSGEEDKWYDSHGLTKILYQLGSSNERIFILDFNIKDFHRIAEGENFFSIIKKKKLALQNGAKMDNFYLEHEKQDEIKTIVNELQS